MMNIDEMEASPEMDALIAERVMGYEIFDLTYYGSDDETPRQRELEPWLEQRGITHIGRYYLDVANNDWKDTRSWHPALNIEDAFDIVEKLRQKKIYLMRLTNGDSNYACWLGPGLTGLWSAVAVGDTPEMAICRAALKAMGVANDTN